MADLLDAGSLLGPPETERNGLAGQEGSPLVNVFGLIPAADLMIIGDLLEIPRILKGLGFIPNVFFGRVGGLGDLIRAPNASLSLSLSSWGLAAARKLERARGVPVLELEAPPVGISGA